MFAAARGCPPGGVAVFVAGRPGVEVAGKVGCWCCRLRGGLSAGVWWAKGGWLLGGSWCEAGLWPRVRLLLLPGVSWEAG